ncbi:hypothetical protein [Oceanobacillus senegalensis]|uniref:hypothetical protein n=1 Tax=Oceanobacillus senegalensis TaxID=1936063 RepID=UPI000A310D76|nr:hypothetical protein [Oceanobacillus senegalensis]
MILLFLLIFSLCFTFLWINWIFGNNKKSITVELNKHYVDTEEYIKAVQIKLENQGRNVQYRGNRTFSIDGKDYMLHELHIPSGIIPIQYTILKRITN